MILVDTFEPSDILRLIQQVLPDSYRHSLNHLGLADYVFTDIMGRRVQFERKQWSEILGGMNKVEEQLRRQYDKAEELNLIIEGLIDITPYGIDFFKKSKGIYRPSHSYGTVKSPRVFLHSQVMAWIGQLDKSGITVYQTTSSAATASMLVALYKNSQKEEHTTLQRYIKPRIELKELNPYVKTPIGVPISSIRLCARSGPNSAPSMPISVLT